MKNNLGANMDLFLQGRVGQIHKVAETKHPVPTGFLELPTGLVGVFS